MDHVRAETPSRSTPTLAGAVRVAVEPDMGAGRSARRRQASSLATSAMYSRPRRGRRDGSAAGPTQPSFVRTSSPRRRWSSRPTGNTRPGRTSPTTVDGPGVVGRRRMLSGLFTSDNDRSKATGMRLPSTSTRAARCRCVDPDGPARRRRSPGLRRSAPQQWRDPRPARRPSRGAFNASSSCSCLPWYLRGRAGVSRRRWPPRCRGPAPSGLRGRPPPGAVEEVLDGRQAALRSRGRVAWQRSVVPKSAGCPVLGGPRPWLEAAPFGRRDAVDVSLPARRRRSGPGDGLAATIASVSSGGGGERATTVRQGSTYGEVRMGLQLAPPGDRAEAGSCLAQAPAPARSAPLLSSRPASSSNSSAKSWAAVVPRPPTRWPRSSATAAQRASTSPPRSS